MFNTLEVAVDNDLGYLWLNRPKRLNALSLETLEELVDAAQWFNRKKNIRAVIVAGRGRAFSAGADLDGFAKVANDDLRHAADAGRIMADAIEGMNAVTVARIQGWCVGGGLVLAAACDLRVATQDAKFSIPEVDLGIPLAWGGIPRLVREIGPALTKELVMTCREFDAAEAKQAGFLNRVVPECELDTVTLSLAKQIAAKPAMPISATKQHINSVTGQMVGISNSWSDADGLVGGLLDPNCQRARDAYVKERNKKN